MASAGSPLQPAAQRGVLPDSMPTAPTRISGVWVVLTGPAEKLVLEAVAPAEVSMPLTPAYSSALAWISPEEGTLQVIWVVAARGLTLPAPSPPSRSPAEPSLTSRPTL